MDIHDWYQGRREESSIYLEVNNSRRYILFGYGISYKSMTYSLYKLNNGVILLDYVLCYIMYGKDSSFYQLCKLVRQDTHFLRGGDVRVPWISWSNGQLPVMDFALLYLLLKQIRDKARKDLLYVPDLIFTVSIPEEENNLETRWAT